MKTIKMARNRSTGEHFMETPQDLWEKALTAWDYDHSHPSPLPKGHAMFKHPERYDCSIFTVEEDLIRTTLARLDR